MQRLLLSSSPSPQSKSNQNAAYFLFPFHAFDFDHIFTWNPIMTSQYTIDQSSGIFQEERKRRGREKEEGEKEKEKKEIKEADWHRVQHFIDQQADDVPFNQLESKSN